MGIVVTDVDDTLIPLNLSVEAAKYLLGKAVRNGLKIPGLSRWQTLKTAFKLIGTGVKGKYLSRLNPEWENEAARAAGEVFLDFWFRLPADLREEVARMALARAFGLPQDFWEVKGKAKASYIRDLRIQMAQAEKVGDERKLGYLQAKMEFLGEEPELDMDSLRKRVEEMLQVKLDPSRVYLLLTATPHSIARGLAQLLRDLGYRVVALGTWPPTVLNREGKEGVLNMLKSLGIEVSGVVGEPGLDPLLWAKRAGITAVDIRKEGWEGMVAGLGERIPRKELEEVYARLKEVEERLKEAGPEEYPVLQDMYSKLKREYEELREEVNRQEEVYRKLLELEERWAAGGEPAYGGFREFWEGKE